MPLTQEQISLDQARQEIWRAGIESRVPQDWAVQKITDTYGRNIYDKGTQQQQVATGAGITVPVSQAAVPTYVQVGETPYGSTQLVAKTVAPTSAIMSEAVKAKVNPFEYGTKEYKQTEYAIIQQYGVPQELKDIGYTESGFNPEWGSVPGMDPASQFSSIPQYSTKYRAYQQKRDAASVEKSAFLQSLINPTQTQNVDPLGLSKTGRGETTSEKYGGSPNPNAVGSQTSVIPSGFTPSGVPISQIIAASAKDTTVDTAKEIAELIGDAGGGYADPYVSRDAISQGFAGKITFGYVGKGYDPLASMRGDEVGGIAVQSISVPAYVWSTADPSVFKTEMGKANPAYYNPLSKSYEARVGTFSNIDSGKGTLQFGSGDETYFFREFGLASGYRGSPYDASLGRYVQESEASYKMREDAAKVFGKDFVSTNPAAMAAIGLTSLPKAVKEMTISATVEPKPAPTIAEPAVVMVRAPDGTMQPDYMVPFGNVTGKKVVANLGTRIDYQPGTEIAAVKPFVAGKVTEPTGKVGIPFTDIAFTIPVVSDVLKYFEPTVFVSGRATSVKEVSLSKSAGPDYTNMFISPETGKATRELTSKVGEPRTTTRVSPITGETETVTVQDYETITLPENRTVATYEPKVIKSEYQQMLDKEFRTRIPSVEVGETALAASQLINPLSTTESAPAIIGREIAYAGAERLGLDTKGARESQEFVTSIVSPTKGQYELFYERPELSAVSFASMGALGGASRGVVGLLGKTGRGAAFIEKASPIFTKYGGPALGGLYGGMISYEETSGFKEVTPQTVARIKARAYQEGIPGAVGFGAGYRAPDVALSAIEPTTTRIKMEYPQFVEESGRVSGTARYIGYKAEPLTKPIVSAISSVKADIVESIKSPEYGKFLAERGYQKYVEIPAKSFTQELIPTMAGEIPGKTVPIESLGKTTGSAQPRGGSTVSGGGGVPPSGSRMTMRMVGGKMRPTLAREPSLKSQGVSEKTIPKEKTTIGTRTDYRGKPASQGMKQIYGIKQSASQSQVLLTERLPTQRYIERQQIPQQQMQEQVLIQRQVEPKYAFEQVQEIGLGVVLAPRFVESRQEMEPVVSSISKQQQESKLTRQFQSIQQSKQKLDSEIAQRQSLKQTELQAPATMFGSPTALLQRTEQVSKLDQSLRQTQPQASTQLTRQTITQIQDPIRIQEPVPTRTPTPTITTIPPPPLWFPEGSPASGSGAKPDRRSRQVETTYIGPRFVKMIRPAGAPKLPWMTQPRAPAKAPARKPTAKSRKKK